MASGFIQVNQKVNYESNLLPIRGGLRLLKGILECKSCRGNGAVITDIISYSNQRIIIRCNVWQAKDVK